MIEKSILFSLKKHGIFKGNFFKIQTFLGTKIQKMKVS